MPDPILDDDGLRRLLKLPEGADLSHYRDRGGLPYLRFRHDGQTVHRYITSEVLQWLVRCQLNSLEVVDQADLPRPRATTASEASSDDDAGGGPYLTVADAAKLLRVGEDTIERMIKNGSLPVVEITGRGELGGRRVSWIRRESLDDLLCNQPWPTSRDQVTSGNLLPIEIAGMVAKTLRPEFDKVRDDIAEYAEASTQDAAAEQSRPTARLLSPNQAAKQFNVSASMLRREYEAGRIEGRRVGAHLKLEESSIAAWCRGVSQEVAADQTVPQPVLQKPPRKPPSMI